MKRHVMFPLLPILLILSLVHLADAQGLYVDADSSSRETLLKSPAHRALSLEKRHLHVEIIDAGATITLSETFHNSSQGVLEGTYVFPIPPGVAATGLSLSINGKEVAGEMLDKHKARQIYSDIVRKARDPALLEYVGHGLLRASVYPIEPKSDVVVTLRFVAAIERIGTLCHLNFPMKTSVRGKPEVVIDGAIASRFAIRNVYSPSHAIDIEQTDDRTARLTHEGRHEKHKNFNLYYSLSDDEYGMSLLTHATPAGENFFLLMLAPKLSRDPEKVIPKDVVFVIDKSGSMEGDKWAQAQEALKYCVRRLNRHDRFGILAFSTDTRSFSPGLVKAVGETKKRAAAFVDGLSAVGGTDLNAALLEALHLLSGSHRLSMVALLTDGLPSVGVTDPARIIDAVRKKNKDGLRIFNFGVGYDVNTHLLDSIARTTKGTTDYLDEEENIEVKVSAYFNKISDPILTDVALDFEGVETFDIYPRPMEDLFVGSSLVAVGRYARRGDSEKSEAAVIVTGKVGDERFRMPIDVDFGAAPGTDFLPTYWAMRKIGYLLNSIRLNGLNDEVEEEVIALGRRYSIVTPYTSALVIENEERLARATGQPADSVPAGTGSGSGGFLAGRGRTEESLRRLAGQTPPTPPPNVGRGAKGSKPSVKGARGPSSPKASPDTLSRRHRLAHRRKPTDTSGGAMRGPGGPSTPSAPGGPTRPGPASPKAATGKKSVKEAKKLDRMARFGNLPSGVPPGDSSKDKVPEVVHVGALSFVRVGELLVDSRFTEAMRSKLIRVESFSDDYFALLEGGDELKKILALGEKIIFLFNQKVYEIYPATR